MPLTDEKDIEAYVKSILRAELGPNFRAKKVQIDSAYTAGNPKIRLPGESAPGGSDEAKKVIGTYVPIAGEDAFFLPLGNDGVVGPIRDVPNTTSEIFGDGSDGAGSITGTTTLTRDTFYTTLSIGASGVLNTAGWRVFVQRALTMTSGGIIQNSGTAGNAGGGGGAGGTAGYFRGGGAGGAGGNSGAGTAGGAITAPGGGGSGGAGETSVSAGGAGGVVTVGDVHWKRSPLLAMLEAYQVSAVAGGTITRVGGGGGGGGGGFDAGQAAGGGGGGGVVALYANSITVPSGGIIRANGGAGGTTGSGDGGGGGGGLVLLVYRAYSNAGTVQASAGAAGGAGASAGSAGNVVQVPFSS